MQAMAVVLSFFGFWFWFYFYLIFFWCIWLLMRLRGNKKNYPYRGFFLGGGEGKGLENWVRRIIVFTLTST